MVTKGEVLRRFDLNLVALPMVDCPQTGVLGSTLRGAGRQGGIVDRTAMVVLFALNELADGRFWLIALARSVNGNLMSV